MRDGDFDRILHGTLCDSADLVRHGSGEHQGLPVLWDHGDDLVHVIDESHIQHPIGLVEDKLFDGIEVKISLFAKIDDSPRGSYNHIAACLEAFHLFRVRGPTIDRNDCMMGVFSQIANLIGHLFCELPRRDHNQCGRGGRTGFGASYRHYGVRPGLSRTCLSLTEHIFSSHSFRYRLKLDRCRLCPSHFGDGFA